MGSRALVATKTRGRPFEVGNPGKPKGARHRATRAVEALLEGEAEALTRRAIEAALGGDAGALKLCLDRLAPALRERPVSFALPPITSGADVPAALAAVIAAVAAGDLLPGEGWRSPGSSIGTASPLGSSSSSGDWWRWSRLSKALEVARDASLSDLHKRLVRWRRSQFRGNSNFESIRGSVWCMPHHGPVDRADCNGTIWWRAEGESLWDFRDRVEDEAESVRTDLLYHVIHFGVAGKAPDSGGEFDGHLYFLPRPAKTATST